MKHLNVIAILASTILIGCSPKFYTPNTQNVPLISESNETNLTLTGNGNQVEFQGAYGVTNGLAVMANGGLFIPQDLDNGNGGSGRFIEIGAGYYRPINENIVFETYGLVGFGTVENHLPSTIAASPGTTGDISANIARYGIQPNLGYKSKYFSAAISSRIVGLSYSKIEGDLFFDGAAQAEYLEENRTSLLFEPAITVKGGLDRVKLQLQYVHSLNLSNSDFRQDNSLLSIGLNFNFK